MIPCACCNHAPCTCPPGRSCCACIRAPEGNPAIGAHSISNAERQA